MFLLTDRTDEGQRLKRLLAAVEPCTLVSVQSGEVLPAAPRLVVFDVALDTIPALDRVRTALARIPNGTGIPVLCLLRDPSHLAQAQARMAGATTTLPAQVDPGELTRTVRSLLSAGRGSALEPPSAGDATASVASIETALGAVIGAGVERQLIAPATLEQAGGVLLAAIGQVKIKAWLDVVWTHDDLTYQHCLLVAGLAAAFAIELGLTPKAQHLLCQAALVHDIGKSRIPHHILNKTIALTREEMVVMRSHAPLGHAILATQSGFHPALLDVVRHHHEFLDGSGYPDRYAGAQVSRLVRMVTICDIYAALIEHRPYKAPVSSKAALAYLESLGPKLDRALFRAFHNVVRET